MQLGHVHKDGGTDSTLGLELARVHRDPNGLVVIIVGAPATEVPKEVLLGPTSSFSLECTLVSTILPLAGMESRGGV
jgi:hypothetical protein